MSFYVRVFSLSDDYPSLNAICDCALEEGFEFSTSPGKDEKEFQAPDWKNIIFQYDEDRNPIELEKNTKESRDSMFFEEQQEFLEALKKLPYSKGQKRAKSIIKDALQIYAFEVDEDMNDDGWNFIECLLDFLCDATDGYVQVDEEGIYDKEGNLLVEME